MATYTPTGTDARGPNLRNNAFRAPYTVWDFKNIKGRGEGVAATSGSHRTGAPLFTFSIVPQGLPLTGSRLFTSTPVVGGGVIAPLGLFTPSAALRASPRPRIEKGKTDYHDHCTVVVVIAFPFFKEGSALYGFEWTLDYPPPKSACFTYGHV